MDSNLAQVFAAVAAEVPDREAIVWGDRRLTYAQVADRANRLARVLIDHDFEVHAERDDLSGWESGQDHLGLYLHNGNEYLEGMLGAYRARVAPFNVNYRYVEEELIYLLNDAQAKGLVFHASFAPILEKVLPEVPSLRLLLQVADDSGNDLLSGAIDYEAALDAAGSGPPAVEPSPDDLYILYTGGTTGMPKGVLWRQADIFPAALGGRDLGTQQEWPTLDDLLAVARNGGAKLMPTAPFMHGAAHWMAFNAFTGGNTIVLPTVTNRLDAADVWTTVQTEGVNILLIVGDAFARPLVDELAANDYDVSSLLLLASGGAALNAGLKDRLLELIPNMSIMDAVGASETGQQANQIIGAGNKATTGTFNPGPGMCIVDESMTRVLPTDDHELGWLAQRGRVPLGYLGDEDKTKRTFPVIGDDRYAIPGDRARFDDNGLLELHGRDSVTINSGGEKIFAEEVEQALRHHPGVYDAVVAGRPSERWGNEVVAVVHLRDGVDVTSDDLLAECEKHIARYKFPKDFVFVDQVVRSPAGKADYRWATAQVRAE
jgi:acyl-CoA synthetase (AMP-forming)/AMP-acid ligase II